MSSEMKSIGDSEYRTEVLRLLRELLAWTKLDVRPGVTERFGQILDTEAKKLVYEYSDGTRGVREVGQLTGTSPAVVSGWWREWDAQGIMEQAEDVTGRRARLTSLAALGIEVPPLPKERKE